MRVISQFVDQFVWIDGSVVDDSFDLHGDVVLGDDLLRSHSEHRSLHVDLDDILADRVDQMEAWLQDLHVSAEGLMDAQLGSGDLIDGPLEAATDAGTPDVQTACEVTAALQTGFVAGTFKLFSLEVLKVLVVTLLNLFVLFGHEI